ncbi:disintegrin and metalloproteinase domain-containing protein 11 isoform X5 [Canis lupus familiaris]|uniref:disintegrin and metalloproteinase domain-containing protein 11 isoform X5 n=1 Tax=Canis lupus familiaris TaxID=9615 RepID=UPI0015F1A6F6|nr:disintegrin and metalloproteinase domain-containing protein 11 isoform X5 [Canis lupus familiaris]XP_038532160.1 disintegrin and metalloproteinase domain-containing protein 11 isoform X5 [Canis lupus familiaris]
MWSAILAGRGQPSTAAHRPCPEVVHGGSGVCEHTVCAGVCVLGGAGDHCYYQGKLRGNPHSFAALSTCQGLHGVFSDGNFTYIVEPREMARPQEPPQGPLPHLIYRTPLLPAPLGCREPGCLFAAPAHTAPVNRPRLRRKRQVRRGHPTVHSETKYVELIVVNDHQLFEQMRQSVVLTSNFAKSVVNLADVMYKEQLNTRIVLVAMETWADGDKIQVQDDLLETLARLMVYRREGLPEPSDATHLFSGRTFQSSSSGAAYVGGICSLSRGGGVNEYDNMGAMAVTLAQTLGQNLGMMWNKHRSSAGDCKCPDNWLGCIMEDTGFYLPRKFSRCSIDEYNQFLQEGGGSCLFNKPLKLLDPPECGNGFVEAGEECDCGSVQECSRAGGNCCKKCTLTHDAMCSDGLCCRRCKYEPRGVSCREAVNECDIAETCTGDSSQCPPNLHKLDGYYCDHEQGRCYGGRCKTRDRQCQALWGHAAADRFCYEKLNVEGTERGNCGRKGSGWVQCNKQDVLCGFLLCVNISGAPRLGDLGGDISSVTFYHQGKELDCRSAAMKGSASVSQTGRAKTAAFTIPCPRLHPRGRQRDIRVPAAPTSSSAPSRGLSWSQPSSWAAQAGDLKTSAAEGTTRPSRGQCDAGHVIPPAVPVSSISFVTSHSVDGELGADSSTPAVTAVTTGVGEPHSGKKVLSPRPFLLPTRRPRPWSLYSHPSCGQTILARWGLGTVSPQPPAPGRGAYLCVPSVLSSMSPLSELPTRSPPWPAYDLPPLGPSTDLPGPGSGALPLGPASRPPLTPPLRSRSGGA